MLQPRAKGPAAVHPPRPAVGAVLKVRSVDFIEADPEASAPTVPDPVQPARSQPKLPIALSVVRSFAMGTKLQPETRIPLKQTSHGGGLSLLLKPSFPHYALESVDSHLLTLMMSIPFLAVPTLQHLCMRAFVHSYCAANVETHRIACTLRMRFHTPLGAAELYVPTSALSNRPMLSGPGARVTHIPVRFQETYRAIAHRVQQAAESQTGGYIEV